MEKFIKRTLYSDFQGFRHIWKFIKPADHQFNKPKFRFNKRFVKLTLVPGRKFNKLFVKTIICFRSLPPESAKGLVQPRRSNAAGPTPV